VLGGFHEAQPPTNRRNPGPPPFTPHTSPPRVPASHVVRLSCCRSVSLSIVGHDSFPPVPKHRSPSSYQAVGPIKAPSPLFFFFLLKRTSALHANRKAYPRSGLSGVGWPKKPEVPLSFFPFPDPVFGFQKSYGPPLFPVPFRPEDSTPVTGAPVQLTRLGDLYRSGAIFLHPRVFPGGTLLYFLSYVVFAFSIRTALFFYTNRTRRLRPSSRDAGSADLGPPPWRFSRRGPLPLPTCIFFLEIYDLIRGHPKL